MSESEPCQVSKPKRQPTRPTASSKRSSSPLISFTPIPSDHKVKNITRNVIKRLEGLGHLDIVQMFEQDESEELEERGQVEQSLLTKAQPVQNGSAHTPQKIDWEIPRKVLHSSIGFVTLYLYLSQSSPKIVIYVLWSALAVIAPADLLRLRVPAFERLYEQCLGFLMRESEKHTTNGVTWYILGVNFALMSYPLDVATVAILILSWADTAASTIGRLWGAYTPRLPSRLPLLRLPLAPRKSIAGFVAASLTGACIAFTFWGWIAPVRQNPADITWRWDAGVKNTTNVFSGWLGLAVISVASGLITGVTEALDLGSLDDNLTLPIISGACILGVFKLLSLF